MRKLSEVLAIALADYEKECEDATAAGCRGGPFMCSVAASVMQADAITPREFDHLYNHIQHWIEHRITLAHHLRKKGLPDHRAARLQFYKDKLAELQANGE